MDDKLFSSVKFLVCQGISINDACNKVGISRGIFYRHADYAQKKELKALRISTSKSMKPIKGDDLKAHTIRVLVDDFNYY